MGGLPLGGVPSTLPPVGGGGGGGVGSGGGGRGDGGDGGGDTPKGGSRLSSRSVSRTRGGLRGGGGSGPGRMRFRRSLAGAAACALLFCAGSLVVVVRYGAPDALGYVSAPAGGSLWGGGRLAGLLQGPTDAAVWSPSRSLFFDLGGRRGGSAARVVGASVEEEGSAGLAADASGEGPADARWGVAAGGIRGRRGEPPGMDEALWGADAQAAHALHQRYKVPRRLLRRLDAAASGRLLRLMDAAAATAAARDNQSTAADGSTAAGGDASVSSASLASTSVRNADAKGVAASVGTGGESAAVPAVVALRVDAATLTARLRALATTLVFARHAGRVPVLLWHVTDAFPYPFEAVFPSGLGGDDLVAVDVVSRAGAYGIPLWPAASGRQVSGNLSINGGMRLTRQPGVDVEDAGDWAELNTEVVDQHGVGADAIGGAAPPFAPGVKPSRRLTLTALVVEPARASRHLILRSNDWLDSEYASLSEAVEGLWARVMGPSAGAGTTARPVTTTARSNRNRLRSFLRRPWTAMAEAKRDGPHVAPGFHTEWTAFVERFVHPSLSNADVYRLLHDQHEVPTVFLDGMQPLMRRRFVARLQEAGAEQMDKYTTQVAVFDAAAVNQTKEEEAAAGPRPTPPPSPKAMFVHTQYGLGNRLRALGSALAFARAAGRVLVLVWAPDAHLQCTFADLFVNDLVWQSELSLTFPFREDATYRVDAPLRRIRKYSFMRHNATHVLDPNRVAVANDRRHHLYVSTAYVIRSQLTPNIIAMDSPYWAALRSLIPVPPVLRRVESVQARVDSSLSAGSASAASSGATRGLATMVGVHIRSRSISTDIAGVTAADYSPTAAAITDYWRSVTGVSTFLTRMRAAPLSVRFFVATDSPGVYDALAEELDASRVVRLERPPCPDRTAACVQLALADLVALSRTRLLLGSHWSSFSEAAGRLGNKRLLLAGLHFGRPRRAPPRQSGRRPRL